MSNLKAQALLKVVEGLPIFAGIGRENAARVMQACEVKHLDTSDTLCKVGQSSDALFVLLRGRLGVITQKGIEVAEIEPVAPVGEMGILTGQPRSATVQARQRSTVLCLRKAAFEGLMRKHLVIARQVHRNVLSILEQRLIDSGANRRLELHKLQQMNTRCRQIQNEVSTLSDHGS